MVEGCRGQQRRELESVGHTPSAVAALRRGRRGQGKVRCDRRAAETDQRRALRADGVHHTKSSGNGTSHCGVKVTPRVQLAPAARLAPQLFAVRANVLPVTLIDVIGSTAVPALVRVKTWAALVVPATVAKVAEPGVSAAWGAGAAVAVLVRLAVCGELAALSVTLTIAVKLPAAKDWNVTLIVQLAATARLVPQVVAWVNRLGFVPPREIAVIASAALPVLVSVSVCAAEVVPATPLKARAPGASVALATPDTVPVRATVWVAGVAVSVTVRFALEEPTAVCVKPIVTVQEELAARVAAQVLVAMVKLPAFVPLSPKDEMAKAVVPVLVRVKVWAALVLPAAVPAKTNVAGVKLAVGAGVPEAMPLSAYAIVTLVL